METRASLARLNIEIDSLPSRLKAPLLLTAIEGRSQMEIADILGITVKAVETRLARARRKLSVELSETPTQRTSFSEP